MLIVGFDLIVFCVHGIGEVGGEGFFLYLGFNFFVWSLVLCHNWLTLSHLWLQNSPSHPSHLILYPFPTSCKNIAILQTVFSPSWKETILFPFAFKKDASWTNYLDDDSFRYWLQRTILYVPFKNWMPGAYQELKSIIPKSSGRPIHLYKNHFIIP